MQLYPSDCQPAFRILFHMADRLVGVFVENKLLFTCDGEKGEHVTTGEGSDKRFLGIDVGWVTKISRRCSRRHGMAAIKAPGVIARIFLINEFSAAALPTQSNFMFGHTFVYAARFGTASNPQPSPHKRGSRGRRSATQWLQRRARPTSLPSFSQIGVGRGTFYPVHVPRSIDGNER